MSQSNRAVLILPPLLKLIVKITLKKIKEFSWGYEAGGSFEAIVLRSRVHMHIEADACVVQFVLDFINNKHNRKDR